MQTRRHNEREVMGTTGEFQRFTREEHHRGDTEGWRFASGWFHRDSGLQWAWFIRDVEEEDRNGDD